MEDSVDASGSFVSLSSILKPEEQANGEHKEDSDEEGEEIMAAEKREVGEFSIGAAEVDRGTVEVGEPSKENTSKEEEESTGGAGGIISHLMSNLTISIPGLSAEESEEDSKKKEEQNSRSPGLINHLLPKLSVTLSDEKSLAADEASILLSIIED